MQLSEFDFDLPAELIAQYPLASRRDSRLLVVAGGQRRWLDTQFTAFADYLQRGDLVVFNDTRVIPARIFGHKASGGRIELLLERVLDAQRALVQLRASKSPLPNTLLQFDHGRQAQVESRQGEFFVVRFAEPGVIAILEEQGHVPLPPYINRPDEVLDKSRYQTVYARQQGAVAAPTAGLHFDDAMLQQLQARGVQLAYLTLHVGAGTFQPVRVSDIHQHQMHKEWMCLEAPVVEQIKSTKSAGNRVVAVGTTSLRALETAAASGHLQPYRGETQIFITPGFKFGVVDMLLTNFHLPQSTLMMLVCAFGGYTTMMDAYRHAVHARYRFFSYGDAMLIHRANGGSHHAV